MRARVLEGTTERQAVAAFIPMEVVAYHRNREVSRLGSGCAAVDAGEEVTTSWVSIPVVLVCSLRVIGDRETEVGHCIAPDQTIRLVVADRPIPTNDPSVARVEERICLRIAGKLNGVLYRVDAVVGDAAEEVVLFKRSYVDLADIVVFDIGSRSVEAEAGGVQQIALIASEIVGGRVAPGAGAA